MAKRQQHVRTGGKADLAGLIHLGQDLPELGSKTHLKEAVSFIKDTVLHCA